MKRNVVITVIFCLFSIGQCQYSYEDWDYFYNSTEEDSGFQGSYSVSGNYTEDREKLKNNYNPEKCWENAEDWLELFEDIDCSGGKNVAETVADAYGIDFDAMYYGWKLMLKALIECPRNEMQVHDDYFVYECYCPDGVPRLRPIYCRDGRNGAKLDEDDEDAEFLDWTKDEWMDCEKSSNGTLELKKVKVKRQKTVRKSKVAVMEGESRTTRSIETGFETSLKGQQKCTPTLNPFPTTRSSCVPGKTYCDDEEFVYVCDDRHSLKTTHCLLTDDVNGKTVIKSVMKKGQRETLNQVGTFLCHECKIRNRPYLCLIFQDVSTEIVSSSK